MSKTTPALSECVFYHSMDLPGLGMVEGQWDLRGRFDDYTGGVDVRGKRFLDVGAASGFLSFEAERRGAIVSSFDALDYMQIEVMPNSQQDPNFFNGMRNSYELAHQLFQSRAERIRGDIYALSTLTGRYDIVHVGQILVHLRDPLAALEQAALCSSDHLVITESSFKSDGPCACFRGGELPFGWWVLSLETYRQWLSIMGFGVVGQRCGRYRCNVPGNEIGELWTIVARRGFITPPSIQSKPRKRGWRRWFRSVIC
jgi:hypothetical protein